LGFSGSQLSQIPRNFLFIKLKIIILNIKPRKKVIKITDCARIHSGISEAEALKSCNMFDIKQLIKVKNDKVRINYSLLSAQYQAIIESGERKNFSLLGY